MIFYLILFTIVLFIYFKQKQEESIYTLFGILLVLSIVVGLGDMLGGYDRYLYAELFDDTADVIRSGSAILSSAIVGYSKEFGYVGINIFISWFTANRYIFILIYTFILYILIFFSFKQYVKNYPFAIILFMALFFFFTFTYLREVMAVAITWLSMKYIVKRDFKKFLLVMICAYSFHNSAVIFLPMYFIPIRKFKIRNIIIIMIALLILGISPIPAWFYTNFGAITGSEERVAYYADEIDKSGFRIEYLIESFFFLFILLYNYKKMPLTKNNLVFFNSALVFCGILLFFIKSSSGGRLSWYYMMGIISSITYIYRIPTRRNKNSIMCLLVICALLYVRILFAWNIYLYPYKSFLTDGHRQGDFIYEKYEYDQGYDNNKFYR